MKIGSIGYNQPRQIIRNGQTRGPGRMAVFASKINRFVRVRRRSAERCGELLRAHFAKHAMYVHRPR